MSEEITPITDQLITEELATLEAIDPILPLPGYLGAVFEDITTISHSNLADFNEECAMLLIEGYTPLYPATPFGKNLCQQWGKLDTSDPDDLYVIGEHQEEI